MVELAAALIGLIILVLVTVPLIRYRIGRRRLYITLAGIPFRWISLKNIRYVTDHPKGTTEHWPNTWNPGNRSLFIRKRGGLFRSIRITPIKHFVFKAELEKAIREINPGMDLQETSLYKRQDFGENSLSMTSLRYPRS